jgi:hypothetical protein
VNRTLTLGQGSGSRESGSCSLTGPSTKEDDVKRSDLKQLKAELADGYGLVEMPRRPGRFYVQAPDGELLRVKPDRSERLMVVGGNVTPGSLHKVRAMLAKAGALR